MENRNGLEQNDENKERETDTQEYRTIQRFKEVPPFRGQINFKTLLLEDIFFECYVTTLPNYLRDRWFGSNDNPTLINEPGAWRKPFSKSLDYYSNECKNNSNRLFSENKNRQPITDVKGLFESMRSTDPTMVSSIENLGYHGVKSVTTKRYDDGVVFTLEEQIKNSCFCIDNCYAIYKDYPPGHYKIRFTKTGQSVISVVFTNLKDKSFHEFTKNPFCRETDYTSFVAINYLFDETGILYAPDSGVRLSCSVCAVLLDPITNIFVMDFAHADTHDLLKQQHALNLFIHPTGSKEDLTPSEIQRVIDHSQKQRLGIQKYSNDVILEDVLCEDIIQKLPGFLKECSEQKIGLDNPNFFEKLEELAGEEVDREAIRQKGGIDKRLLDLLIQKVKPIVERDGYREIVSKILDSFSDKCEKDIDFVFSQSEGWQQITDLYELFKTMNSINDPVTSDIQSFQFYCVKKLLTRKYHGVSFSLEDMEGSSFGMDDCYDTFKDYPPGHYRLRFTKTGRPVISVVFTNLSTGQVFEFTKNPFCRETDYKSFALSSYPLDQKFDDENDDFGLGAVFQTLNKDVLAFARVQEVHINRKEILKKQYARNIFIYTADPEEDITPDNHLKYIKKKGGVARELAMVSPALAWLPSPVIPSPV